MSAVSRKFIAYTFGVLALPILVASCGGKNEPVALPGQAPMADHDAVSMVRGVVTSAHPGSDTIMVGDDEVVIADATVSENGVVVAGAQPKVGETVTLSVTRDPNSERFVAQAIDISVVALGPVGVVNPALNNFSILGQTVSYAGTTVIGLPTGSTLTAGMVVKVSGTVNTTNGTLTATKIEYVAASYTAGSQLQVAGLVQSLNPNAKTFALGTLNVSYVTITPTFTLADRSVVFVGSTTLPGANGILTATEISNGTATGTPANTIESGITIKGPIESLGATGTTTFNVMGQTVSYSATTTTFVPNQTTALVQNAVVRVIATPGTVAGQWVASRVEFVSATYTAGTAVQVTGTVQNANPGLRTFSLGTLSVNYNTATGITFTPANGNPVVVGANALPVAGVLTATNVVLNTATTPTVPGTPAGIDLTAAIQGPVDSIQTSGSFVVLGQTITTNTQTQFVTSTGASFIMAAGNVVKVTTATGIVSGPIVASRVDLLSTTYVSGTPLQVSGAIQNLDSNARTFQLGTLIVNYNGLTNLTFTPTLGMNVVVAANALPLSGVLNATAMATTGTTVPGVPGTTPQPTIAVVSGTVTTALNAAGEFNLTGVTVHVSATTQFLNGSQAMLLPGIGVMVTGTLSGGLPNAMLEATMIRFSGAPIAGASRVQIRGPVEFIDVINRRLSVLGVTVTVPPSSIFVRDDDPDHSVNLANLRPGQVVTVAGVGTNRQINATFLAVARSDGRPRDSDDDDEFQSRLPTIGVPLTGGLPSVGVTGVRAWLWAPLDAVQAPMLSAFGIPVTTTADTAFFPAGHNTRASSPTTFFGTATTGRTVRVEGVYANGTFVASRVCIVNSLRGSDFADDNDGDNDD